MSKQSLVKYRKDYKSPEFTIEKINLEFDLEPQKTIVSAQSLVKKLDKNATDLQLFGENLTLISVEIEGKIFADFLQNERELILYNVPDEFSLKIVTEIQPDKNTALEGLYVSGKAMCSQCEAEGFRRITFYLDRPDVLAQFTTKIIAQKLNYPYLLSNGNKIDAGDLENGKHFVKWEDPFPKPSYLFALVAGDFDVLRDEFITKSNRKITLELFVDKGNLDRANFAMESLKKSMKWDEERFDFEYDLDIYMIVAVDFFNMGAMENKGLNIFNDKFVLANPETATDKDFLNIEAVIAHEYFHNWTGNRITCRDWFQLSLKEGLTVFRDQEFSSDLGLRSINRIENVTLLRSAQFAEDASPMSHPIRPEKVIEMNNFYTLTVYEKGAEVIRMIHTLLGEEKFQKGMKLYVKRHDGSAATCEDFICAMEDASEIDLTQFRFWYSQSGTPILTVFDHFDKNTQTYQLDITQETPKTADQNEKVPLHIPFHVEFYKKSGEKMPLIVKNQLVSPILNVKKAQETFIFEQISEKPILALLGDFSAPVKLNMNFDDSDLIFLMKNAENAFVRYDSAQNLMKKYLKKAMKEMENEAIFPHEIITGFREILHKNDDPALIAKMIMIPSENEMAEWFELIDPDAIYSVRNQLIEQFSIEFQQEFFNLYQENQLGEYHVLPKHIAKRMLKNTSLFYLAHNLLMRTQAENFVRLQYKKANNMTDSFAALSYSVSAGLVCSSDLLSDFESCWKENGLVMDKWFNVQAMNPQNNIFDSLYQLLDHPSFSLKNPNRVRALVGAFSQQNPHKFHHKSGKGYEFLYEILTQLNEINPQTASRLIEPLIRFKRYDLERQNQMQKVLQKLANLPNLSSDLQEKIGKSLS